MKHIIKRERLVQFIAVDHFTVEAESVESAAEIVNEREMFNKNFKADDVVQFDYSVLQDDSETHMLTQSIKVVDPVTGSEINVEQHEEIA